MPHFAATQATSSAEVCVLRLSTTKTHPDSGEVATVFAT